MNRQKKQTIIAIIVLVIIAGLYYMIPRLTASEVETEPVKETINNVSSDEVLSISFNGQDGSDTFTRSDKEADWVLEGSEDRTVIKSYITTALGASCTIKTENKLENITDYGEYGFDDPVNVVTIKTAIETHTVKYGMYNAAADIYYVMVDDDPCVYIYSHSETLPFNHEKEYFLESLEEETKMTTEEVEIETETETNSESDEEESTSQE